MHFETTRYCNLKLLVLSNPIHRVGLFRLAVVRNSSLALHLRLLLMWRGFLGIKKA